MRSRPEGRIHQALILKETLAKEGFWWQAQKLEIWIKRAQKGVEPWALIYSGPEARV
jgi:hypothetical protein